MLARLHSVDYDGDRPRRLRPPGQLLRPPDRPLDQAVPRRRDRAHRGDGAADRRAAGPHPDRRHDDHRPRRLPARERDVPPDRAAPDRRARLGALDARPPARRHRLQLPCSGIRSPSGWGTLDGVDFATSGIPTQDDLRRRLLPAHRPRTRSTTSTSTSRFAAFRLASIGQGVFKRNLDGIGTGNASRDNSGTRVLAELALKLIEL